MYHEWFLAQTQEQQKTKRPFFNTTKTLTKIGDHIIKLQKKCLILLSCWASRLWYVRCVSLMKQAWTRWNVRAKTRKTTLAPIMQHMFCYLREHTLPTRAQSISLQLFNKQSTASNIKNKFNNQLWFLAFIELQPLSFPRKNTIRKSL